MRRLSKLATAAACLGALAACGCHEKPNLTTVNYQLGDPEDLANVRRAVLVELRRDDSYPGVAEDTTVALAEAVRAGRLFRLDVIRQDDPICKTLSLESDGGFTLAQLHQMRTTFQCDAILLGRMRNFRPHPCMRIGLELQLLDLKQGKVLWAVDYTWDTMDKTIERRIKSYYYSQLRSGLEPMDWQLIITSPKAFERYVAYETAQTLPASPACGEEAPEETPTEKVANVAEKL